MSLTSTRLFILSFMSCSNIAARTCDLVLMLYNIFFLLSVTRRSGKMSWSAPVHYFRLVFKKRKARSRYNQRY
jgi:hypothetical protein